MIETKETEEIVLDLSGWNEAESYAAIKVSGVNHVILKAINKSQNADKKFEQHLKGCIEAGIKVIGTYHYSYATTVAKAKEAARAWIRTVNGRCNMFFLDWEDACLPKDSRAIEIINAYADEIHRAGHKFAVYCGLHWYNTYLKKYADKLSYDFWIARYYAGYKEFTVEDTVNEKYIPAIAHNLSGWQYTSSGKVPGIKGSVDINLWYKDIVLGNITSDTITVEMNPFTEPQRTIRIGSIGEGAKWTQWYLWRFGLIDKSGIDGIIGAKSEAAIMESQKRLGLTGRNVDGVVGKITRGLYMKIC